MTNITLSPGIFGPQIFWHNVIRLQQHYHQLIKTVATKQFSPDKGKVSVLSSHIDDEPIGAGGNLLLHITQGGEVYVNYFEDCSETRKEAVTRAMEIDGHSAVSE